MGQNNMLIHDQPGTQPSHHFVLILGLFMDGLDFIEGQLFDFIDIPLFLFN